MSTRTLVLVIAAMWMTACSKNQATQSQLPCGPAVVVDQTLYGNTNTGNHNINNAVINGDCLEIGFASSGCSGNTWTVELIDSGVILDSNPRQRLLKLKLVNNELCTAVISKAKSFDISALKVSGTNKIRLVLAGFNGSLIYQY
jgi:hypothetical protein